MTDYYVGIDVHKTEAQVAVLDDEGQIEQEVRVGVIGATSEPLQNTGERRC